MTLQYLKDNHNNTTAVVISISDWEKITFIHQDIKLMMDKQADVPKRLRPSDFRGCISSQTADMLNTHLEQSRTEWNNNF